jgi:choline monooxygenase
MSPPRREPPERTPHDPPQEHPMNLLDPEFHAPTRRPLLEAETLHPSCYTSREFFEREIETIFRKVWTFVGRVDQVPNPGDYFTTNLAGVELAIVRGTDGVVRALVNSCRHRGAKVLDGAGSAKALKCPYHGWLYRLDGALAGAPGMESAKCFDRADFPLLQVRTEFWAGFIFVNFDAQSESLQDYLGNIDEAFQSYRMEEMVCTKRYEYEVPCNWKIYVENAMEAFHVPHVHRRSINKQRGSVQNDRTFDTTEGNWVAMHKEHEGSRAILDGQESFPRLPGLEGKAARGTYYPLIFPTTMLGCTVDCMWYLDIHPLTATTMRLIVGVCFPKDVIARPDFEGIAKNYYGRFEVTTQEDIDISVVQQKGVTSPLCQPGRLSEHEPLVHEIDNWVLDHLFARATAKPRRYSGFRVQDLDALPENVV